MTPATPLPACSILILAGGRGQRMGGRDKGLVEWHGRPLIEHLYQVARPLTDDLIVSCNRNAERYAAYADQLVSDSEADFPGPLAGILAGLRQARHDILLVLPCDAPLVDQDLLLNMRRRATQAPEHPLMLRRGEQWEPLFTVLPNSVLAVLEQAWQNGERSPRRALQACAIQPFDCAQDDARLANLNTPELLVDTAPHE